MELLQMLWNGTGGLGPGTVFLKALFIIFLGAVFWMICELVKYLMNIFSKLAADALRYLAIVARGWPKDAAADEAGKQGTQWNSGDKGPR